ncbi:MAG TPA: electron transport complex subunit RsxC [Thiolapillus brandeum]|uniref:Ion-translocating oxidoreductase complex subunit C n=1 Tax=Thiolapillus brandeum TaxID=1076588 RepID=A0A7C5IZS0_9GAMM|nr:electron transport complex subunit RsxC [Thiolapillus brandeum]
MRWFRRRTFSHGIHPPDHKAETAALPIRRLPFPEQLVVPLNQHIGRPAVPLVHKGQEVVRGEPIARADGFLSAPVHAPATGRVRDIRPMPTARDRLTPCILIDVYEAATQEVLWHYPWQPEEMDRQALVQAVQEMGLVGLGGAAFPSHVKLSVPEEKPAHTLVVNGCECEPYLSCDHRVMVEQPRDLLRGVRYALRATGAKRAIIGIEDNKPDAIALLQELAAKEPDIEVEAVETKYPQGSEKMLIRSLLGLEVPTGGIPLDIGVVVNNVGTLAMLGALLPKGEALTERVVTVTGPGVRRPGNYRVPLGTPIGFVLKEVGYEGEACDFVLGGPMMGPSVSDLRTPVTKGSSGLLVLDEPAVHQESRPVWPCIQCGRCVNACPMHLNPAMLGQLAAAGEYDRMAEKYHLADCFECGSCSWICPSNIPLVQQFRVAKQWLRDQAERKQREAQPATANPQPAKESGKEARAA